MNTLLVAVDGSDCATRAVAQAVGLYAGLTPVPAVHLLYVHVPVPVGAAEAHVARPSLDRYYLEDSASHLCAAEDLLQSARVPFTRHIHVGDPAEVLVHQAAVLEADLIVMGNHGRGALADAVLGSVAHRVLRRAPCPVLLVK